VTPGRSLRSLAWLVYVAVGAALAGAAAFLPARGQAIVFALVPLTVVAAVLAGQRLNRPERRLPWRLFAVAALLWAVGALAWGVHEDWLGRPPVGTSALDGVFLLSYAPLAAALLALAPGRTGEGDEKGLPGTLLDAAVVGGAAAALVWVYGLDPILSNTQAGLAARAVSAAYPILDVVLLAILARLVLTSGARLGSYRLLAGGLALMLVADVFWRRPPTGGTHAAGDGVAAVYVVALTLLGAAVLHPSMRRLGDEPVCLRAVPGRWRLALLAVASLAVPTVLVAEGHHLVDFDVRIVLVVGATVLPLLVLARLALLLGVVERTAAAAVAAEGRLRSVVDASPLPVMFFDLDQRVRLWSRAAEEFTGRREEEVLGRPYTVAGDAPEFEELDRRIGSGESVLGIEVRLADRDGALRDLRVSAAPLRDASGEVDGIVSVVADVTERKQVEEALARRTAILDAVAFAAERFLRVASWEDTVPGVLERLGEAAEVSRVYVIENRVTDEGVILASERHGWTAPGIEPAPPYEDISIVSPGFARWADLLAAGGLVSGGVDDFEAGERAVLAARGVRSVLLAPIVAGGRWWGSVGFEHCLVEREWDVGETEALRAGASALGAAIDRGAVEVELRETTERLQALVRTSPLPIVVLDVDGNVTLWNPAAERLSGWSEAEVAGGPPPLVPAEGEDAMRIAELFGCAPQREALSEEVQLTTKSGEALDLSVWTTPVQDADGAVAGIMAVIVDLTERKRQEDRIRHLAGHDPLTDLPNRRAFEDALALHVKRARRGSAGSLFVMDLDDFKIVNDTLGHPAGDRCLIRLAGDLGEVLRPGDLLARFGGDEFAVLVDGVSGRQAKVVAERLQHRVSDFRLAEGDHVFDLSISIGICPIDGSLDCDAALARADSALYEAKEQGRNRVVVSVGARREGADAGLESRWATRIKDALRDERLVLQFQPIVRLESGESEYVEALVRMRHENGMLIGPGSFLPAAERFGLMPQIDRWVVEQAVRLLRQRSDLRVFVNLAGPSLDDGDLLDLVAYELRAGRIGPGRLGIEVTEQTAVRDLAAARYRLAELRGLGCLVALDDFGVGFSSFEHLKVLPADFVKIGDSFVARLKADPANRAIVQGIAAVAHALGKQVIAEAVETESAARLLASYGIEYGQGHLWGRPSAELAPSPAGELTAAS